MGPHIIFKELIVMVSYPFKCCIIIDIPSVCISCFHHWAFEDWFSSVSVPNQCVQVFLSAYITTKKKKKKTRLGSIEEARDCEE